MENNSNLQDPQEIQNLDMTDASLEGKTIELDKAPKKSRRINLKWLDGIEEKPKKIKGTPDVNVEPTSKGARFLKWLWSYTLITFGTALIAVGIYFFKFPNHFTIGGVSSMAVLLAPIFAPLWGGIITESVIMTVLNTVLLIVALIVFGKSFAIKTVYSTMLLNVLVLVFERVAPLDKPLTEEPFLEMLLTIGGIAIGSAILFSQSASSGGTDIIAMIFKRFTRLNIGTALMISDAVVVALSPLVFHDMENYMTIFLCSATGLFLKSFIVDNVMDGINLNRCFIIVTASSDLVCNFINKELHRGATVTKVEGSFSHEEKKMIITVLNRTQASILKQFLKQSDPHAFTIITNSSDIQGKGFRIV